MVFEEVVVVGIAVVVVVGRVVVVEVMELPAVGDGADIEVVVVVAGCNRRWREQE